MTGSNVENEEAKPLGRWSVLAYGIGHVLNDIASTYWYTYLLGMPPKQVGRTCNYIQGNSQMQR